VTVDLVIDKYIADRDMIAARRKALDEELKPIEDLQEKREAWLGGMMAKLGATSVNGTRGRSEFYTVVSVTTADKKVFNEWVIDNEKWEMADIRPSKTAVTAQVADGEPPPPGVNYITIKKVKVVRK
jgi:hypothetical protein